ncbi:MAG TPA: GGDEF domain-containing protein [Elusimicrobiales bacterium]|nr:GGDEF domain-containing protein [Elusimicrobiales bacterium]HOL61739.1 GGDEF domain-containing protein [Elusimicrobiales bacterium]HPO94934.1 GGDEF domain-containing protein [Elusimicrobiales bacterium]
MNEINILGMFYFFIVYFLKRLNYYLGLISALLSVVFFFLKGVEVYVGAYAVLSSALIIIFSDKNDKNKKDKISEALEEKAKLEKVLNELKKETEVLLNYDKKNQNIYSIFNILSQAVDLSSLKSIEKYLNESLGAKTSLYIKSEEGFLPIYGFKFEDFGVKEVKEKDGKTVIPVSDGEVYCYFIIDSVDPKIKSEATDIIFEISPLIKRIYLFNKIDSLSLKDGLTGLYRRGIFNEKIDEEIVRARNFKHTLGLMMIDIDHFKHINDTYGHQAGDEILKGVARVIRSCVYETDFVARYGGEEFVVIMPRAERGGSFRKANFIRESVEKEKFKIGLVDIKVTISVGIAYYPQDALNKMELIEKADKALYMAKESGRNRVIDYGNI